MKIMISGSMTFAKDMLQLKKDLEELNHEVVLPLGIDPHLTDPSFTNALSDNLQFCIDNDVIRANFNQIQKQDAILVFNKKKNGIEGYMGTSTLMEMAIAHFLNKKIFVYSNPPHFDEQRWAHEVAIMQPVIIEGNLVKIK